MLQACMLLCTQRPGRGGVCYDFSLVNQLQLLAESKHGRAWPAVHGMYFAYIWPAVL